MHFLGIGNLFIRQNRLEECKGIFFKGLSIPREIDYKVGEADCLLHLGKLSLLQEDSKRQKNICWNHSK